MNPSRWRQIEELFLAAEKATGEVRAALLANSDPEVRARVEAMLAQRSQGQVLDLPLPAADRTEQMLAPGSMVGPYQIDSVLGVGGMGAVYRAFDSRLGRRVAIKVAGERFSARFERETRNIAALNHPHICTVYDVGPNYLVLELVDGEPLSSRLKEGPLPAQDVFRFGGQIAAALAEAHSKGIIHRDLKPGNIMLSRQGAKVLDFGIAKSPQDQTLTGTMGMVGTPAYMAPEQLDGADAGPPTDVYAFGLVLYEMATGRRLVPGQALSETGLRGPLKAIIERCTNVDPAKRWRTAAEVASALAQAEQQRPFASRRTVVGTAATAAAVTAVGGAGWWWFSGRTSNRAPQPVAAHVFVPIARVAAGADSSNRTGPPAIDPAGASVVVSVRTKSGDRMFMRRLDSDRLIPLEGSEGASYPFWSPDSRNIGFFAEGKLKRIPATGGKAETLCEAPIPRGGTWSRRGSILFSLNRLGLFLVPEDGGKISQVTEIQAKGADENSHRHPIFLPDGNQFLYLARTLDPSRRAVYWDTVDHRQPRRRLTAADGQFAVGRNPESGDSYLLTQQGRRTVAQRFDPDTGQFQGEPKELLSRAGWMSSSETGVLALRTEDENLSRLSWRDRNGKELGSIGSTDDYWLIALSPDGQQAATVRHSSVTGHFTLCAVNLPGGQVEPVSKLSGISAAVWSQQGSTVYYGDLENFKLYRRRLKPLGEEEFVRNIGDGAYVSSISPDQQYLAAEIHLNDARSEVVWCKLTDGTWQKVGAIGPAGLLPSFSPDGRWLAFASYESGGPEIYVADFPGCARRTRISTQGGLGPRWRRDGRELFYVASDGMMTAVELQTVGSTLQPGQPKPLFKARTRTLTPKHVFDVTADGQRFLVIDGGDESRQGEIELILNWPSLLSK